MCPWPQSTGVSSSFTHAGMQKTHPCAQANTPVQMRDGAGLRELPLSWVLDVPAKDTPALAIAAILPLFLICFDQHLLPLLSSFTAQYGLRVLKGPPFPCAHHELLRKPKKRERFPGVVPSSLLQTHIIPLLLLLISQLQLKTILGTMEVSADPQHKGAFSASPPLCTHTHAENTGR